MEHNENFFITIDGRQTVGDSVDKLSLSTLGSFARLGAGYRISYAESAATGFDGDYTTLTVEGDRVTMQRSGNTNSQLVIEKGRKHLCHYDTEFGDVMIGIRADSIDNRLCDSGGRLKLRYSLDVNANALSVNELDITVKERNANV